MEFYHYPNEGQPIAVSHIKLGRPVTTDFLSRKIPTMPRVRCNIEMLQDEEGERYDVLIRGFLGSAAICLADIDGQPLHAGAVSNQFVVYDCPVPYRPSSRTKESIAKATNDAVASAAYCIERHLQRHSKLN